LFSGPITAYGDRAADRANVVMLLCWLLAAGNLLLEFASGFWMILAAVAALSIAGNPIMPVIDSIVLSGVRRYGADYGRIRLWGSVFFLATGVAVGWIVERSADADIIVHLLVGCAFATALSSLITPRIGARRNLPERGWSRVGALLRNRALLAVVAANALAACGHGVLFTFATLYWLSLGIPATAVGVLWAIGTLAEIVLFQFAGRFLPRVSPASLMVIGGVGGTLRWMCMPLDLPFAGFAVLQTLHALSFGATHLGLMRWIAANVEEKDLSVANGIAFVVGGAIMGVAVLSSGFLYDRFGAGAFAAMALPALIGTFAAWTARRVQPQSSGTGGSTSEPS
jgi:PPP family 3-phenylpropionic acid transporter